MLSTHRPLDRLLARALAPLLAISALLASPAVAQVPTSGVFDLDHDLYSATDELFGEVMVSEDGAGGLHFEVSVDPELVGRHAALRRIYLSMGEMREGLRAIPDDPDALRMMAHAQESSFHTLGAEFGVVVSMKSRDRDHRWRRFDRFHHHKHGKRKAPLHEAGFTLVADAPLSLDDVLAMTATSDGFGMQIGVKLDRARVSERRSSHALLVGLFTPDALAPGGGTGGPPTTTPPPPGGVIPPGCFGEFDPATGELLSILCP